MKKRRKKKRKDYPPNGPELTKWELHLLKFYSVIYRVTGYYSAFIIEREYEYFEWVLEEYRRNSPRKTIDTVLLSAKISRGLWQVHFKLHRNAYTYKGQVKFWIAKKLEALSKYLIKSHSGDFRV